MIATEIHLGNTNKRLGRVLERLAVKRRSVRSLLLRASHGVSSTFDAPPVLLSGIREPLHTDVCELAVQPGLDFEVERIGADVGGVALDGHPFCMMPLEFLDPDGDLGGRVEGLAEPDVLVAVRRVCAAG